MNIGSLADPYRNEARRMIETQVCWWCGHGPFVALVGHTWIAHGVYAKDLRRLAGLTKKVPVVSEELCAIRRTLPQVENLGKADRRKPTGKREYSEAGLAIAKKNARQRLSEMTESQRHDWHAAGGTATAKSRQRPHPCTVCGRIVLKRRTKACSLACRSILKARAASISMRARIADGSAPAPPVMTDERRRVLSQKQKANWQAGVFKDRPVWQRVKRGTAG